MERLIDADKLRYKHSLNTVNTTMPQSFPCITKDEINKAPTVKAILKANYENRLKDDMAAILTELKNELIDISWNIDMYDSDLDFECCYLSDIDKVIQQKIDKLKGERNDD